MTLWMLWAIGTGLLLGSAGHLLELVVRASGRPGRWIWLSVITGSIGLQLRSVLRAPDDLATSQATPFGVGGQSIAWWSQLETTLGPASLDRIEPVLGALWLAASLILAVGLVGGFLRLHRRAARWPERRIGEHDVLVSDGFGPALLGFRSPRIVVPRRMLEGHPEAALVICRHEAEHRATKDGWVLAAGAILAAAFPWNLALWWQLRRLRTAVEMDCDQRVLRSGIPRNDYARILLALGQGGSTPMLVPALFHPPLERRLDMLVRGVRKRGPVVTLGGVCVAAALIVGACEADSPTLEASVNRATPEETAIQPPSEVEIRGLLPGAAVPLVFVDGDEVDGEFYIDDLDPESVESIEVIKGPAALEIYGVRAGGGVINITLKTDA